MMLFFVNHVAFATCDPFRFKIPLNRSVSSFISDFPSPKDAYTVVQQSVGNRNDHDYHIRVPQRPHAV